MPPRPTSTTALEIILLVLSMLPPPRTRAMASAAEGSYGNLSLGDGSPTGYSPSSVYPLGNSSTTPFVSTADPSISPQPPPLTAPSAGNLPARRRRSFTRLRSQGTLEPDIFCESHPPFEPSDGTRCMVLPETQKRLIYCHPINGSYGVCCAYRINSSVMSSLDPLARMQLIASWIKYYKTEPGVHYSRRPSFYYDDDVGDAIAKHNEASPANLSSTTQSSSSRQQPSRTKSRNHHSGTRGSLQPHRPVVPLDRKPQSTLTTGAIIAMGSALLGLLCTIAGLLLWCKRNRSEVEVPCVLELVASAPRRHSHRELAVATQGFADEAKIGRGGFGPVYLGCLGDQDRQVAIKVLLPQGSSVQGAKEFEAEVRVMTRLRHRNIVELVGWCDDVHGGLLLVYEFVPHGSLDKRLYDPHRVLPWSDRYKIALGVGSAILYLHTECEQCVVHGDIKPANILLDASCNPKLGDFGLSRFIAHDADPRTTQVVAGTLGYIDPEFVSSQRPGAESDVYSFGVVLLETACGRRPSSTQPSNRTTTPSLVKWVRDMYRQGSILGAADRRLDGEFDEQQMKRVLVTGLWCTHQDQCQRPLIMQAMDVLRREDAELPVLGTEMHITTDMLRSLEERAYGDLSEEDSPCEESPAETEYHTSEETTPLLAQEYIR